MNNKIVIVYDSDHPGARKNICFTREFADKGSGHEFTYQLSVGARAQGVEVITGDIFLMQLDAYKSYRALLMTDMHSAQTNKLIAAGAIPFLNYSFESPLIARGFYMNIARLAGKFQHNIQFGGTKERLTKTKTSFETLYYPVNVRAPLPAQPWQEKRKLVLVNSNKRIFRTDYSTFKSSIHSLLSEIRLGFQKATDPWMRSKEIYTDRIEIIKHFSQYEDFELYGVGWNNRIRGFSKEYQWAAQKVYKGELGYENKLKVMNQFKFNICFENCEFPGYVTEKIFDSLLSGSIPIYYGAPDIHDFISKETFVDYRQLGTPEELGKFLNAVTEKEGNKMINAAREFLTSDAFNKYDMKSLVKTIIDKAQK